MIDMMIIGICALMAAIALGILSMITLFIFSYLIRVSIDIIKYLKKEWRKK